MNRPDPIVANAANVNLAEASKHLIGVLQELNDTLTDIKSGDAVTRESMLETESMIRQLELDYTHQRKVTHVAELGAITTEREYINLVIEYQTDLLEQILSALKD